MKRILFALLLLALSVPAYPWGGSMMVVGGGTPAAAAGYVLQDSQTPTVDSSLLFGYSSTYAKVGSSWITGSGYTLTKLTVLVHRSGSTPTFTFDARIYSDGGTSPGTLLATSTNSVNVGDVGTSATEVDFTFSGLALSATTEYYCILRASSYDTGTYLRYNHLAASGTESVVRSPEDPESWTVTDSTMTTWIKTYSGTP